MALILRSLVRPSALPACRLLLVDYQAGVLLEAVLGEGLDEAGPEAQRGHEAGGKLGRAVLLRLCGPQAVGELAGLLRALEDLLGVPCGQGLV